MHRLFQSSIFCICCLVFGASAKNTEIPSSLDQPVIQVFFSPQDDIQGAIVHELNSAKLQVLVQAYLLTDNKIADALIAAHRRGVDVQVLLDAERDKTKSSDGRRLFDAGVTVRLEKIYGSAHNKVMIIDKKTVLTGSYNFTYAAQYKNAENLLLINKAPKLVMQYISNWQKHFSSSDVYPNM